MKTSIIELKGVGEKTQKYFEKLGVNYVEDLYRFYPRRYDSFTNPVPVSDVVLNEGNVIKAVLIGSMVNRRTKNLVVSTGTFRDQSGDIEAVFFRMPFLSKTLRSGCFYILRGRVINKNGKKRIEQPKIYSPEEYEKLQGSLQPIYPLTDGLSNLTVQKCVKQALSYHENLTEILPAKILEEFHLMPEEDCVQKIHFPKDMEDVEQARGRLVFQEFLLFIIKLRLLKKTTEQEKTPFEMIESSYCKRLIEMLPYKLTSAQLKVWVEIREDLLSGIVMNRLIQGDVGSGKTMIAILALLMTVANGFQGCLMAPTEVLASQHMEVVKELTEKYQLPFKPILLTGSLTAKQHRQACEKIESGEVNLIIGTHAVFQEKVTYKNLALVVTDEQHRFGVRQREMLASKGNTPHVLVMSATPIPRSLAIILYGDLKVSVIDEMPRNRIPIKNCVVGQNYRKTAYDFMIKEIANAHQVYVICPAVDAGEDNELENVVDYAQKLRSIMPDTIQIGCLHGKMKSAVKNKIMEEFGEKKLDILVSTTVIEVGINVPNATVMMIENAERFGLAALHQLRGRVGRGNAQSYCIFMSSNDNEATMKRLNILKNSNDGFFIANEDLRLRGPGDLFGVRQSGDMDFKVGDIYRDANILQKAAKAADEILIEDATLSKAQHKKLAQRIFSQMGSTDTSNII